MKFGIDRLITEPTLRAPLNGRRIALLAHPASVKPWRIQALAFKAIRRLYPDYPLWRDFAYENEQGKLAIDVINGGPLLRDWVDDARATPQDLDTLAIPDEQAWLSQRQEYLCY